MAVNVAELTPTSVIVIVVWPKGEEADDEEWTIRSSTEAVSTTALLRLRSASWIVKLIDCPADTRAEENAIVPGKVRASAAFETVDCGAGSSYNAITNAETQVHRDGSAHLEQN